MQPDRSFDPRRATRVFRPLSRDDYSWAVWGMCAAFGCYFCMYGFRKPFTAGRFDGTYFWGVDYKTILVTAQVLGYTISKFWGIKVIAEIRPEQRARMLMRLIALALLSLVLFGLTPRPWNLIFLFLNGLPLGMVFGLVLGFLEGRRLTELLTAALCASFILADGVTKSVGIALLNRGVPEDWMPAVAGGLFLLPMAVFVSMLTRLPPPNIADIAARTKRVPMNRADRWSWLARHAPGVSSLTLIFLLITILRSVRADFQPEIWQGLGGVPDAGTFTQTELWVTAGVMLMFASLVSIRDNHLAFYMALGICAIGLAFLVAALLGLSNGILGGYWFMVLIGLGLYFPYVAFHTMIFERLLAMTRDRANVGFLMYVVDATGYLGYVSVMVMRHFFTIHGNMLEWFTWLSWLFVVVSIGCLFFAVRSFGRAPIPRIPIVAHESGPTKIESF